jgi:hypothetical protein
MTQYLFSDPTVSVNSADTFYRIIAEITEAEASGSITQIDGNFKTKDCIDSFPSDIINMLYITNDGSYWALSCNTHSGGGVWKLLDETLRQKMTTLIRDSGSVF